MTVAAPQIEKVGRYELITRIATGGMAEIYLARERGLAGLERLVVIKRILPHLLHDPAFVDMFLREARIIARLAHPNVVQIYELGEEKGSYYLALEYIHGCTVRELQVLAHRACVPFPSDVAVAITMEACRGAHAAHDLANMDGEPLGLVHRDISPHNLMVTPRGHVKLLDFGIAKGQGMHEATASGNLKGKYAYMSPEQCLHDPLDRRSDVFALGIVLWELCGGRRLFYRRTEIETLQSIIHGPVPSVRLVNDQVPLALDAVIKQALATNRDERYASADAFRKALAQASRELGYTTDTDGIAGFVVSVAGDSLHERDLVLDKAREQTINSQEAQRLTHATGVSFAREDTDQPTIADGPTVETLEAIKEAPSELLPALMEPARSAGFDEWSRQMGTGNRPAPGARLIGAPDSRTSEAPPPSEGAAPADTSPAGDESSRIDPSQPAPALAGPAHGPELVATEPSRHRGRVLAAVLTMVAVLTGAAGWWFLGRGAEAEERTPRLESAGEAPQRPVYQGEPLRFGFAPTVDAEVLIRELEPLRRYIEDSLQRPVLVEVTTSYAELAEKVVSGELNMGMFPPLLYVKTSAAHPEVRAILVKKFDGATSSDGYLVVPHTAKIRTLEDLRGKRFCFTDRDSTTGYFLPRAYLRQAGFDPNTFVGSVHFSGGHLQVIRDVIEGVCDAAATYNGAFLTADSYGLPTGRLRVFGITGHIPQDVVAVGSSASPEIVSAVRDALLRFSVEDTIGEPRLGENQRLTGFVAVDPGLFDELREILREENTDAASEAP